MNPKVLGCSLVIFSAAAALSACGGGGGNAGSGGSPPTSATMYTLGGTVTGLSGSGLVLQFNGGSDLALVADGSFTFSAPLTSGETYSVAPSSQPTNPWQTCVVTNPGGTISAANVTNVLVECTTNAYQVGGVVTGLNGFGGLVLQNNNADNLAVAADGGYTFSTPVKSGNTYNVSMAAQPAGATCTANGFSGTVAGEDVTTVTVKCSAVTYTVGGTVTGLLSPNSGLVLSNRGTDVLPIVDNGPFTFSIGLASGGTYIAAVASQPTHPAQTCVVTGNSGTGTVGTSNVTSLVVECLTPNSSGSLDLAFDSDGMALTDFNNLNDYARAVAIQPDGKIVVAGYANTGFGNDFALARYNGDGSLDTHFGNGGKVTTSFGGSDAGQALIVQPDGKIVVAGSAHIGTGFDFGLARFNADGSPDIAFGVNGNGKVTTDFSGSLDYAQAVALQTDGKIIVAGQSFGGTLFDFAIARYNADGTLDTSFNTDGSASGKGRLDFGGKNDNALGVAVQTDGKIVLAGYANGGDFAVARYNTDGSLDTTGFGMGTGKVVTNLGGVDLGQAVIIQPTGEIVVAGYSGTSINTNITLLRYTTAGVLDPSFDNDGIVTTDIGGANDVAYSVALDAGGNIVVAGRSSNGLNDDFAIVRYSPTGALDTQFGGGGIVTSPIGGGNDEAHGVAIQSDGKIVVVGHTVTGSNTDFAVIRVNP